MKTICGIEVSKFSKAPTPDELGSIAARMSSEDQAKFFLAFGEELRNHCGGLTGVQWDYIAESISLLEEKLCDGSASQLVAEIHQRLTASTTPAA